MKHTYFINDRIRLRAMEPEDLELICEMENDPQQWDISNFTVPYSRYVMKQYMENSQCDMFADKQLRMMIVRLEDGIHGSQRKYEIWSRFPQIPTLN